MSTELENVKKQEEEYSASNIQVLEGLEAVRKRPASASSIELSTTS